MLKEIRMLRAYLKGEVKKLLFREEWRAKNKHNFSRVLDYIFPIDKVTVGEGTYGTLNVISYGNDYERLKIGNYCSIAGNTFFILSGEHDYKRISTYPFQKVYLNGKPEAICKGEIIIEDDVWIGYGVIILSGVTIGKGAVIGAGSVVTKNVPPYAVFANNQVIKYRFSDDVINKLQNFDLKRIDKETIEEKLALLQQHVSEKNIDTIIEKLLK